MEQQEAKNILKGCGCIILVLILLFVSWYIIAANFDMFAKIFGTILLCIIGAGRFIPIILGIIIFYVIPVLVVIIFMIKVILVACGIKK